MNPIDLPAHSEYVCVLADWLDMTDPKRGQICAWCMHMFGENWGLRTTTGKLAVAYHMWQFTSHEDATQFKLTWGDQIRIYSPVDI